MDPLGLNVNDIENSVLEILQKKYYELLMNAKTEADLKKASIAFDELIEHFIYVNDDSWLEGKIEKGNHTDRWNEFINNEMSGITVSVVDRPFSQFAYKAYELKLGKGLEPGLGNEFVAEAFKFYVAGKIAGPIIGKASGYLFESAAIKKSGGYLFSKLPKSTASTSKNIVLSDIRAEAKESIGTSLTKSEIYSLSGSTESTIIEYLRTTRKRFDLYDCENFGQQCAVILGKKGIKKELPVGFGEHVVFMMENKILDDTAMQYAKHLSADQLKTFSSGLTSGIWEKPLHEAFIKTVTNAFSKAPK